MDAVVEAIVPAKQQEATSYEQSAFAARKFLEAYRGLSKGERAALRRSDIVATRGSFWRCLASAESIWPAIKGETSIAILEALVSNGVIDKTQAKHDAMPLGVFIRSQGRVIKPRRIEALLAATKREDVMEEISRLMAIAQGGKLDFGFLFRDLFFFGDRVRRKWAHDCFAAQ